jgi:hypothetical protein
MDIAAVILEHDAVRLSPIRREHWLELWEIAKDSLDDTFRWIPYSMRSAEDFQNWLGKAIAEQERGESLVFGGTQLR